MVSLSPTVVEVRHAREFLQHVLKKHAPPSTLIVCSSKADFLETLQPADASDDTVDRENDGDEEQHPGEVLATEHMNSFAPTLRLLSTSRTAKLAFCPDITHLRAYLACLTTDNSAGSANEHSTDETLRLPGAVPILAILNPLELHRPTSAFSAQGINRTLAVAVEAAHRNGQRLVLAETHHEAWMEELSILNVANRRLGELAVGRTVTARAVAERWCTFERHAPPDPRWFHQDEASSNHCSLGVMHLKGKILPSSSQSALLYDEKQVIHRPVLNLLWNITSSRSDTQHPSIIHHKQTYLKDILADFFIAFLPSTRRCTASTGTLQYHRKET